MWCSAYSKGSEGTADSLLHMTQAAHNRFGYCYILTLRFDMISYRLFAIGFEGLDAVPRTFVLMGNFQSQPATTASTDYIAIREQFKTLANIIGQYQRLQVSIRKGLLNPQSSSNQRQMLSHYPQASINASTHAITPVES